MKTATEQTAKIGKGKPRNTKPGRPPYLIDPRISRPGEKIGGGYFIFRRGRKIGRVQAPEWPYEHPNLVSAQSQLAELKAKHPAETFEIFASIG